MLLPILPHQTVHMVLIRGIGASKPITLPIALHASNLLMLHGPAHGFPMLFMQRMRLFQAAVVAARLLHWMCG
jgi:hypothetical protein